MDDPAETRGRPAAEAVAVPGAEHAADVHRADLLAFVRRLTHDHDAAQDIVQETLLRAWRHPELADRPPPAVRAWLFTVARRLVIDRWRSGAARHEITTDVVGDGDALPFGGIDPDRSALVLDRWIVTEALRALSLDHRRVVVAAYYEGRSTAEIAGALRIPEGTVKSRLHYGLRSLRLLLQERGVTAP